MHFCLPTCHACRLLWVFGLLECSSKQASKKKLPVFHVSYINRITQVMTFQIKLRFFEQLFIRFRLRAVWENFCGSRVSLTIETEKLPNGICWLLFRPLIKSLNGHCTIVSATNSFNRFGKKSSLAAPIEVSSTSSDWHVMLCEQVHADDLIC